jgi:hypothetical protein
VVAPVLRSGAKLAIRGGLIAYDWTRQRAADLGEVADDVAAEARADAGSASHTARGSKSD